MHLDTYSNFLKIREKSMKENMVFLYSWSKDLPKYNKKSRKHKETERFNAKKNIYRGKRDHKQS